LSELREVIAQLEEERVTAEDQIIDLRKEVSRWKRAATDWGNGRTEEITTKVQVEVSYGWGGEGGRFKTGETFHLASQINVFSHIYYRQNILYNIIRK